MFRKSEKQKRLDYLGKFMANGYKYALIDSAGDIKATYRYKYETSNTKVSKGHAIVTLKDLFDRTIGNSID